jgi:cytochrome c-type biogenesis protein CcmH
MSEGHPLRTPTRKGGAGRSFALSHLLAAALLVALAALPSAATAQGPTPSADEVNAIAKQLYCPVCENVPLDVCPTAACEQWRETIREKLALGWNEDQIKQYFVEQYGQRVLATPPPTGLNWLVYLLPPAVILFGAFLLARAFRGWQIGASAPGPRPTAEDPYAARLEEELQSRG